MIGSTAPTPEIADQSYVERPPHPGLATLVSSVWIQRIATTAPSYRQLHIPTGGAELTCRLGTAPTVRGPATGPATDTLPPGAVVVGVRIQPGVSAAVFGLAANALRDTAVDLPTLWGPVGTRVSEMINDAASAEKALTTLQRQLLARTRPVTPDRLVVAAVHRLRRHTPWSEVSEQLSVSDRQLRRRCEAAAGLAPKTLHRVLRFQQFVAATQQQLASGAQTGGPTFADLAAQTGYADEAHLNRECVRLTGRTPGAYLTAARRQCACGHEHAASYGPQLAAADTGPLTRTLAQVVV